MAKRLVRNPNEFEEIIVNGCLIEPNTIYEIVAKDASPNSPPIYQDLGSIKERFPGVGNSTSLSQYDTGFFEDSPVFSRDERVKNDWDKRRELAEKYFEIFALPMKMYIPEIDRIRTPTDDVFFDLNYPKGYMSVVIEEGIQFNTSNPVDRFKLYIALIEGELVMKGKRELEEKEKGLKDEMDMFHQSAQFAYISMSETKSKKEQLAEIEMEASYRFGELVRSEKEMLVGILSYINVPVKSDISRAELNMLYKNKVESDKKKLKEFVEMIEQYDKRPKELKIEFELLEKIKSKKGRELIQKDGSSYYYKDIVLGSNIKSAVSALMKAENEEILKEFYFNFD